MHVLNLSKLIKLCYENHDEHYMKIHPKSLNSQYITTKLGWVYCNGEIHIVEPETEESYHHAKMKMLAIFFT